MHRAPLLVSGTIFGLIALIHLYRLYSHFNVIIGSTDLPDWASIAAVIISGVLSLWMFSAARCRRCDK